MAKHTAGPWIKDYGGTRGHIKAMVDVGEKRTPTVCKYDRESFGCALTLTDEEIEANGNLLAAAPEMLEALRDAVRLIEHLGGNASHQKKMIAKAEACDESAMQSWDIRFEHVVGLIVMAGDTASTYGPQQISIPEQAITVRR